MATSPGRPNFSIPLRIPQIAQHVTPERQDELNDLHNSAYQLLTALDIYSGKRVEYSADYSQLSYSRIQTGDTGKFYAVASGAIAARDMVDFTVSGSTVLARVAKADAVTTPCKAYALSAVANGAWGEFRVVAGVITGFTALTPGLTYYLSTATGGAIQSARPAVVGQIIQTVGWAISDTVLMCTPNQTFIAL